LGAKGGSRYVLEPHRHAGVFVARGKEDLLVTKNLVPVRLPASKRIFVSRRIARTNILFRVNQLMVKSAFPSTPPNHLTLPLVPMATAHHPQRLNTVSGTPSVRSWPLVFSVVWTQST